MQVGGGTTQDIEEILDAQLRPEQAAAARDSAPEVLALACAGSGKSRTLAYRIARLVALGTDAAGIVAFTFTEKAADSIKLRVARALDACGIEPEVIGRMYIGTIHAYCQYLLTHMDARFRQFEVLDENRLKLFLISRYPRLGLAQLRDAHRTQRGERAAYFRTIAKTAEAWMTMNDELLTVAQVAAHDPVMGAALTGLGQLLDEDEYIDFSLMVREVVDRLGRGDPAALAAVEGLEHVLVDEYQDVNPSQERLIELLHRNAPFLFAVGDDDQAVYAWRGADVSRIQTFATRYSSCSQHTLAHNFRSTPTIVELADAFAAAELGAVRIPKNPTADPAPGAEHVGNIWFPDRQSESAWIVQRIQGLLGTEYRERDGSVRGLTPADFGVLMRSTRTNERSGAPRHAAFTEALRAAGIPYTLEAGGSVFDRPQVAALRDSFELLRNRSPSRPEVQSHFGNVVLPAFPQADFEALARVMSEWGRLIHTPPGGTRRRVYPQQLVHDLLSAFHLEAASFDDPTMQDIGLFSRMLQDVEGVYLSIDDARRFQDVLNFLQQVAADGYNTSTQEILRRPDAVAVSTVHKVKGLEFPVVFVVDVEGQRFPKSRSQYDGWLPAALLQGPIARGAYHSTPEEEARLFYTAVTRAERYLYVTGCAQLPGASRMSRPTRYSLQIAGPAVEVSQGVIPAGLVPAQGRRRIDETILPTSYSDVRYYLRCPADYRFRKTYGFSPPITEMFGFGRTVHASVGKLHEAFVDAAPTPDEARQVAEDLFHLKHVPPSNDPASNPGPYERAKASAVEIAAAYVTSYSDDFSRRRQVEVRFEIPVEQAVMTGSIDLMLKEDPDGNILEASVIDFKAMEGGPDPSASDDLHWTELALQVQLYARAALEVLGENARTGAVHLLKDQSRVEIPVDQAALDAAIANVEWAVDRIIAGDFPRRPHPEKCGACDFRALCPQTPEGFQVASRPPAISIPGPGQEPARVFSEYKDDHVRP